MDEFNWKAHEKWNDKLIEHHAPKEETDEQSVSPYAFDYIFGDYLTKDDIADIKGDEKYDREHGK